MAINTVEVWKLRRTRKAHIGLETRILKAPSGHAYALTFHRSFWAKLDAVTRGLADTTIERECTIAEKTAATYPLDEGWTPFTAFEFVFFYHIEILHCRYEQLTRGVANDFYEPVWKLV